MECIALVRDRRYRFGYRAVHVIYAGSLTQYHGPAKVVGPCPLLPGRMHVRTADGTDLYRVRLESLREPTTTAA